MSAPRILFSNATNSPRHSSSPTRSLFDLKLRKSSPTCTLSLTSVSTNGLSITASPRAPTLSLPAINVIPFPSSPPESDPATSHDTTGRLLHQRPTEPSQSAGAACSPEATQLAPTQERRKRSTARLLQPLPLLTTESRNSELGNQPPRKRPRLLFKGTKSKATRVPSSRYTPVLTSADLRFLATVQRSVAYRVKALRQQRRSQSQHDDNTTEGESLFEAQDLLLVSRLKSLLIERGIKATEVVDLDEKDNLAVQKDDPMDVDMDIDAQASSVPPRIDIHMELSQYPPCYHPLRPQSLPTSEKIVAALLMRHRSRRPPRSSPNSERNGGPLGWIKDRRPSPLGASQPYEYSDDG